MNERTFISHWITPVALVFALSATPWHNASAQDTIAPSEGHDTHEHTPGDGVLYGPEAPPEAAQDTGAQRTTPAENAPRATTASDAQTAVEGTPEATEPAPPRAASDARADRNKSTNAAADTTASAEPEPSDAATSADDTAYDPQPPGANVSVGESGLKVQSADGRFALGLTPFIQMGYRQVGSDFGDSQPSGFVLEHFRPTLSGKYNEILSYNFILQITPSTVHILNAFVTFHAHPVLNIRVGLQKPIYGIERRQAQHHLPFYNRSLGATFGASRDIGIALDARLPGNLQFEIGAYNGTEDGRPFSGIQEKSVAGDAGIRWYAVGKDRPTTETPGFLTVGAAALLRRNEGNAGLSHLTPRNSSGGHSYSTYADGTFADGRKFASSVFAHGGYKSFYAQAEFSTSNQQVSDATNSGRVVEHAWQATATYTLGGVTGWTGTTPNRSLFDGGLGALQIKARAHGLNAQTREGDFLSIAGTPAESLSAIGASAGLSWHISHGLRIQGDYNWTTFGVDGNRIGKANEHVFFLGLTAGY